MIRRLHCRAFLFDLDGVLVDSAHSVRRAWRRWAREQDLVPTVVEAAAHGRRTVDTIRALAPHLDAARAAHVNANPSTDLREAEVDALVRFCFDLSVEALPPDRIVVEARCVDDLV